MKLFNEQPSAPADKLPRAVSPKARSDERGEPAIRGRSLGRKRRVWIGLLVAALSLAGTRVFCNSSRAVAAEITATEEKVTALFIFKIGLFVEWPASKFAGPTSPIIIGVLGSRAVERELDTIARTETINGRRLLVRRLSASDDPGECHILFVSRDTDLGPLLPKLKAASVLTFGQQDKFAQRGGIINLVLVKDSMRYKINPDVARKAGLKINPQLTRHALEVINSPPEEGGR